MIRSFCCRKTERLFRDQDVASFRAIERPARRKLLVLHAATSLRDLGALPGTRLEVLRGQRQGRYSIRINRQWRVCFTWSNGDAYEVEITDYH